ncbi:MAG: hypothetical protein SGI73_17830 [Chloroflexota bacterium]|nr:hypothetical protein [Chloroflexota bacterium]
MARRLLLLILLALTSCQTIKNAPRANDSTALEPFTNIPLVTPSPVLSPTRSAPTPALTHLETTTEGVLLAIDAPSNWETDIVDGLLLAEHSAAMNDGTPGLGMLVYIFAPPNNEFAVLTGRDGNFAHSVLNHVVRMPGRIGRNVAVSEPVSFDWDGYDAAYYLLSGADAQTMVLAVAIPLGGDDARPRLVVCNLSIPPARTAALRAHLPGVLDGLTIDGVRLNGAALDALPDPLPFPSAADEAAFLATESSR